MQLSFLIMGTFLDDTAMLVIVAPLYVPLVGELGFDLIWYGVLYTVTTQIAYMTPPFGYNLFLMRAMAPPEIAIKDIYGSILPFVGAASGGILGYILLGGLWRRLLVQGSASARRWLRRSQFMICAASFAFLLVRLRA